MIRESLDAGSPHASMFVTPGKGLAFQSRATSSGTEPEYRGCGRGAKMGAAGPRRSDRHGVSLHRRFDVGSAWVNRAIALTQTVFAGLALSSHVAGQLATATFTSVAVGTPLPDALPASTGCPGWREGTRPLGALVPGIVDVGNVAPPMSGCAIGNIPADDRALTNGVISERAVASALHRPHSPAVESGYRL